MNKGESSNLQTRLRKYDLWYKTTLIIGLLGLIDIATTSYIGERLDLHDRGAVSLLVYLISEIFGERGYLWAGLITALTFRMSLIYLVVAWILNSKVKKLKSEATN